jgi:hypothetical protein
MPPRGGFRGGLSGSKLPPGINVDPELEDIYNYDENGNKTDDPNLALFPVWRRHAAF